MEKSHNMGHVRVSPLLERQPGSLLMMRSSSSGHWEKDVIEDDADKPHVHLEEADGAENLYESESRIFQYRIGDFKTEWPLNREHNL